VPVLLLLRYSIFVIDIRYSFRIQGSGLKDSKVKRSRVPVLLLIRYSIFVIDIRYSFLIQLFIRNRSLVPFGGLGGGGLQLLVKNL
jgi:hypothetical protein